jgi:hypothetical protein
VKAGRGELQQSLVGALLPGSTANGWTDEDELRAESGVVPMAQAEPDRCWRVAGNIQAIGIDPREALTSIEARVSDGTGCLVAKWIGWSSLRGLAVRRAVVLEGFVDVDSDGQRFMLEPDYEIVSELPR